MPPGRVQKSSELQKRICSVSFQEEKCRGVWEEVIKPEHSDLSFICEDAVQVRCHQAVLAVASTHLRQLFTTSAVKTGGEDWLRSTVLEVNLPGVRSDILSRILSLLYCGLMEVEGKTMLKEIKSVWSKVLKIDIVKLNNRDDIKVLPPGEGKNTQEYNNVQKNIFLISNRDPSVSSGPDIDKDKVDGSTLRDTEDMNTVSLKSETDDGGYNIVVPPSLNIKRKTSPTQQSEPQSQIQKKKMKTISKPAALSYSVEEIHRCEICEGKKDGKIDKQASELSFTGAKIKKLKEHYSKHFYEEGKILRAFPPEEDNLDDDGNIIDEFGKQFIYKCEEENCWKSKIKRQGFGYKEIALHQAAEHGLFEKIASTDERDKVRNLLQRPQFKDWRTL